MKTLLWKAYFWIIVFLDMISFVVSMDRRLWEMAEMGFFLVALIGLFGYCWERQILNRIFWQVFSVVFLCWLAVYFFVIPRLPMQDAAGNLPIATVAGLIAVTIVMHLPLVTGVFLYAFRRGDIWEI
jgi:hypothetical protein